MGKPERTLSEINRLTGKLIEHGLSADQKYPILQAINAHEKKIDFERNENFSIALRNIPYSDSYAELKRDRNYNLSLLDGALIQLQYSFFDDEIVRHRLAFLPSPDLLEYQNEPEIYDNDVMYAEVLDRRVVASPIRFDFDRDAHAEYVHPSAHVTIGQYTNCRIPMQSALSPFKFFEFVLSSFYNTAYNEICNELGTCSDLHPRTISNGEKSRVHVSFDCVVA